MVISCRLGLNRDSHWLLEQAIKTQQGARPWVLEPRLGLSERVFVICHLVEEACTATPDLQPILYPAKSDPSPTTTDNLCLRCLGLLPKQGEDRKPPSPFVWRLQSVWHLFQGPVFIELLHTLCAVTHTEAVRKEKSITKQINSLRSLANKAQR